MAGRSFDRDRFSTSTLIDPARCVPWLAADGPLAYTQDPPATDYFFQYSWIVPAIFAAHVNRRRHHYFGAPLRESAAPVFEFWRQARRQEINLVHRSIGALTGGTLHAPVAVYRAKLVPYHDIDLWLFWRGTPLVSHQAIVNLIAATTTRTGLRVKAALDTRRYTTALEVPDEVFAHLKITPHTFHGDWNYTIAPRR